MKNASSSDNNSVGESWRESDTRTHPHKEMLRDEDAKHTPFWSEKPKTELNRTENSVARLMPIAIVVLLT